MKLILTTHTKGERRGKGNFRDLFRSCQKGFEKNRCQTDTGGGLFFCILSPTSKHHVISQFIVTNLEYHRLLVFISSLKKPLLKNDWQDKRPKQQNAKYLLKKKKNKKLNPEMLKSRMINNF